MHDVGVLTFADNEQYLKMARLQSKTLERAMNIDFSVAIPDDFEHELLEETGPKWNVIRVPRTPVFENEYMVYDISPYHETIKVDADMIWTKDCTHWFRYWRQRDIFSPAHVLDFRGNRANDSVYRPAYQENSLPNVYSNLTYFRKSKKAREFYRTLEIVTREWKQIRQELLYMAQTDFSTDLGYAVASVLSQIEIRGFGAPTFVHMKPHIIGTPATKAWYDCLHFSIQNLEGEPINLMYDNKSGLLDFVVHGCLQTVPFHYYDKGFMEIIDERKLF